MELNQLEYKECVEYYWIAMSMLVYQQKPLDMLIEYK